MLHTFMNLIFSYLISFGWWASTGHYTWVLFNV
jgi:hypothetical protein